MSKLDYCNITLAILPSHDLGSLQSAINAATHLSQCTAAQPLTPLLADLQWLRMPQHIQCKLCALVYQCTHGSAPSYLKMPSAQSQAKNHGVVCALRHWPISSYWHCDVQRWATVCRRRSTACLEQPAQCYPLQAQCYPLQLIASHLQTLSENLLLYSVFLSTLFLLLLRPRL